jgi:hypothetical protein
MFQLLSLFAVLCFVRSDRQSVFASKARERLHACA